MTKTRVRVAGAVGVVLLAGLLVAWSYFAVRVSTDDAQIDGHVNSVSARVGGTVSAVLVADNQFVEKGTPLVRIEARAYEIAVARAAADLAENEAQARAAHTNVPMTSTVSSSHEAAAGSDFEGSEARLVSARARAREAVAKVTKAAQDLARLKPLLAKDEVSQQEYDVAVWERPPRTPLARPPTPRCARPRSRSRPRRRGSRRRARGPSRSRSSALAPTPRRRRRRWRARTSRRPVSTSSTPR